MRKRQGWQTFRAQQAATNPSPIPDPDPDPSPNPLSLTLALTLPDPTPNQERRDERVRLEMCASLHHPYMIL